MSYWNLSDDNSEVKNSWGTNFYLPYPIPQIAKINLDSTAFLIQYYSFSIEGSEKAMAPHSSTLAWKLPWMEEPGGLQSMGSLGVGHD